MKKLIRPFMYVLLSSIGLFIAFVLFRPSWGTSPKWTYHSWNPLFGGWSKVSTPLFEKDIVYFCSGYGWWEHKFEIVALNTASGDTVWKNTFDWDLETCISQADRISVVQRSLVTGKRTITWDYRIQEFDKSNGKLLETKSIEKSEVELLSHERIFFSQQIAQICSQIKGFDNSSSNDNCCQQIDRAIFLKKNSRKVEIFSQNLNTDKAELLNSDVGLAPKYLKCVDDKTIAVYDEKYLSVYGDKLERPFISRHTSGFIRSILKHGNLIFLTDDSGTLSAFSNNSD